MDPQRLDPWSCHRSCKDDVELHKSAYNMRSQEWIASRPGEPQDEMSLFYLSWKRGSFDYNQDAQESIAEECTGVMAKALVYNSAFTGLQWHSVWTMPITGVTAIVWSQLWKHLDHRSVLEELLMSSSFPINWEWNDPRNDQAHYILCMSRCQQYAAWDWSWYNQMRTHFMRTDPTNE